MLKIHPEFDWSLRSCGRHGHVTYRPDETELADRLHAQTAAGDAWRCLRCEDFVVGEPSDSGPADDAPVVLRGNALRDAVIMRLLAIERFFRFLMLGALAYGIWKFDGSRDALQRTLNTYLPLLKPLTDKLGVDLTQLGPMKLISKALTMSHSALGWVAIGIAGYALLELLEGIGLWIMKRWGEYVAVVGTAIFIPLEMYELVERVTVTRVGAMIINIFAVAYLVFTKRLFGIRGGAKAYEAERHSASLMQVERSALSTGNRHARGHGGHKNGQSGQPDVPTAGGSSSRDS